MLTKARQHPNEPLSSERTTPFSRAKDRIILLKGRHDLAQAWAYYSEMAGARLPMPDLTVKDLQRGIAGEASPIEGETGALLSITRRGTGGMSKSVSAHEAAHGFRAMSLGELWHQYTQKRELEEACAIFSEAGFIASEKADTKQRLLRYLNVHFSDLQPRFDATNVAYSLINKFQDERQNLEDTLGKPKHLIQLWAGNCMRAAIFNFHKEVKENKARYREFSQGYNDGTYIIGSGLALLILAANDFDIEHVAYDALMLPLDTISTYLTMQIWRYPEEMKRAILGVTGK